MKKADIEALLTAYCDDVMERAGHFETGIPPHSKDECLWTSYKYERWSDEAWGDVKYRLTNWCLAIAWQVETNYR